MERKLARIEIIDTLLPIEKADRIEVAVIGGWNVIVQKGLYTPGSKAVFCEVDSLLPLTHPAFESLESSSAPKVEEEGKQYARIRTMKMRGVVSQGFCVPLSIAGVALDLKVGTDVSGFLGVIKYVNRRERDHISCDGVKGIRTSSFPSFIPRTDQNRVQNIIPSYNDSLNKGEFFEKSFKLDGSSMTVWNNAGVPGVASRNVGFNLTPEKYGWKDVLLSLYCQLKCGVMPWKLKIIRDVERKDNAFTLAAKESGALDAAQKMWETEGRSLAFQGELVGPNIQKNFEGVDKNTYYIYDVYDIKAQRYLLPDERVVLVDKLGLNHVPLASTHAVLLPVDVPTAIKDASGPSGLNGKYREGFVYKSMSRNFSFKVISNEYLLKEE